MPACSDATRHERHIENFIETVQVPGIVVADRFDQAPPLGTSFGISSLKLPDIEILQDDLLAGDPGLGQERLERVRHRCGAAEEECVLR